MSQIYYRHQCLKTTSATSTDPCYLRLTFLRDSMNTMIAFSVQKYPSKVVQNPMHMRLTIQAMIKFYVLEIHDSRKEVLVCANPGKSLDRQPKGDKKIEMLGADSSVRLWIQGILQSRPLLYRSACTCAVEYKILVQTFQRGAYKTIIQCSKLMFVVYMLSSKPVLGH